MVTLSRDDLKKIANDSVLDILKSLKERDKTLSELAQENDISKSTTHFHLQKLKDTDLINVRETDHKWKYYELTNDGKKIINGNKIKLLLIKYSPFVLAAAGGYEFFNYFSQKLLGENQGTSIINTEETSQIASNIGREAENLLYFDSKGLKINFFDWIKSWINQIISMFSIPETHLMIGIILIILSSFLFINLRRKYAIKPFS